MHILVLAPYYWPDSGAASSQFTMLCEELVARNNQVTVIAAVPHYPSGKVASDYRSWKLRREQHNGVRILRVPLPSIDRSRMSLRIIQFLVYQLGASFWGRGEDYDVLLLHGPSLEMFLPYYVLGVLRHKPIVYSVHDIYPDVGVKLGVFRHSTIIRLVGAMEDYCLSHAARVRILSTSFAPALEGRGVDADKIRLIYDYVDPEAITPLPRDNPFACEHGLDKRFVVLYTGNMGYVQALNSVIDAAHRLEEHQAIGFVFVGEGAAKASLIEQSQRLALDNVKFIGWQPAERMAEIYASGDICLVSLSKGMAEGALPSKSFSIMAAARVLLASVDPGSDAWDLVERSHAGIAVPPESPDALSEAVLRLYADPKLRQQMGRNGRNYVLEHHSPASAAQQFDELLVEAVESYNGREATHERSLPAD